MPHCWVHPSLTLARLRWLSCSPCRSSFPFFTPPSSPRGHDPLLLATSTLLACPVARRTIKTQTTASLSELPSWSKDQPTGTPEKAPKRVKNANALLNHEERPAGQPATATPLDPLLLERDGGGHVYSTVIQQARDNMKKYSNCVLLTRVGGFYELYFEHAEEYGPLLNLKVATRKSSNAPPFAMSGFPFFQLDRYLKILVQDLNRYVAIAEEFRNDASEKVKAGGLMNDRKVSRIITPGTLIDETFMDPLSNNYVLAIHTHEPTSAQTPEQSQDTGLSQLSISLQKPIGLAWSDLSTGHFLTQSTTLASLPSLLARISPREIVLDAALQGPTEHGLSEILAEDHHLITYQIPQKVTPITEWERMLEAPIPPKQAKQFSPEEIAAGSALLQYLEARLQGSDVKLQPPRKQLDVMGIDKNTMRALEIKKTMRDGVVVGSLLHTIRKTVTKGGARLLDNWLGSPSTSLEVIESRLDVVSHMLDNATLRERITILLKRSHDSHRLIQKFAFGRGDPDDLLDLATTIDATHDLANLLQTGEGSVACIEPLLSRIDLEGPLALAKEIRGAIDEEGLTQQHRLAEGQEGQAQELAQSIISSSGSAEDSKILPKSSKKSKGMSLREHYSEDSEAWTMKPLASSTLDKLHKKLTSLADEKAKLGEDLSNRLGATTLTLKFSPGLGHICHVKGKDMKLDFSSVRSVSASKSTRSFYHPEWTTLGNKLVETKSHIRAEEQRVFATLREAVIRNIVRLRRNASVLDELDIASSFAVLADEKRWVRPVLNNSASHKIVGGRHPTVETGLEDEGRTFVTNDCHVGSPKSTWLITGPNMAGKSTFLRQNALITILAQIGSYVPAAHAELGIVDQIFSRVGSADNLYKDQSTFMVEMLETANILKTATSRSFVIMDEIGRGTTPEDGTAVAFACLWHLSNVNRCRTLFATHFHQLTEMVEQEGLGPKVGFYCTDVEEDGDGSGAFRYIHLLKEGINRQSHALKVARLAGLPEKAVGMAKKVLDGTVGKHVVTLDKTPA